MVVEIFWHAAHILMLGNKLLCANIFWLRLHCVWVSEFLCVVCVYGFLLIFLRVAGDISTGRRYGAACVLCATPRTERLTLLDALIEAEL